MSRTHHGTAEIFVSDANDVEYLLHVAYVASEASPAHWCRSTGSWDPPEGAELEQCEIRCVSITFNHGKRTTVPVPDTEQLDVGYFCNEVWGDEINEKVLESASVAAMQTHDESDPRI